MRFAHSVAPSVSGSVDCVELAAAQSASVAVASPRGFRPLMRNHRREGYLHAAQRRSDCHRGLDVTPDLRQMEQARGLGKSDAVADYAGFAGFGSRALERPPQVVLDARVLGVGAPHTTCSPRVCAGDAAASPPGQPRSAHAAARTGAASAPFTLMGRKLKV